MKKILLSTACAGAMSIGATSAIAQATPDPDPQDTAKATEQAHGEADIVVTAQRRSERILDVPVSITALSADRLESAAITSTEDLTVVTPGLVFARSNSFAQPTIRGIGARNGVPGDESPVAIYVDGVYSPEQFANLFELEDVQQIEVLKGPQGTLFGRNAAGGAINITTRMPSDHLEASVSGTVGENQYLKAAGYITAPLTDTLGFNLSAAGFRDRGFIHNIYLNTESGARSLTAVRGKLVFDPAPGTRIWIGGHYSDGADNSNQSGQPLDGNSRGRQINPSAVVADQPWTTSTQFPVYSRYREYGGDAHLEQEIGGARLSVVTAYTRSRQTNLTDADNTSVSYSSNDTTFVAESFSAEAILASTGSHRLNWTLGANLFTNKSTIDPYISGTVLLKGDQRAHAQSVFGEATLKAIDRLFLTVGARYSWEQRIAHYNLLSPSASSASGEGSWRDLSPRAVIRYEFSDHGNVYASYSRGFKSGTFNEGSAVGASTPANPEHIDAYELGLKARLMPGVNFSTAGFYYKYNDLQVTVPLTIGTTVQFALANSPKSRSYGLEANLDAMVFDGFTVRGGVSLLNAKFEDFPNAVVVIPNPAYFTGGKPAGNQQVVRDVSSNYLSRSPTSTFNLGAQYETDLAGGRFMISGDLYHSARWYSEPLNRLSQPAYTQINASASWRTADEHLTFTLSVENLTDAKVYSNLFASTVGDFVSYQRPSFLSFKVGYKFP